ncbi:hypothetical protein EOM57_05410 [Candidatus Saccharibacteria bacterium]|nr:hypothetical protein [Candidatus Saccharibacteria bacterium]
MIIEHLLKDPLHKAMLIPFGDYKNMFIREAPEGTIFETIDSPPKKVELIASAVISPVSPLANALSMMIYNQPIRRVFKAMRRSWRYDIHDDQLLLIIVKEIMEEKEAIQHNVAHLFAEEMIVPWVAISNNVRFALDKPKHITTADFVDAKIIGRKEIHILSEEGVRVTRRLYGIPVETLLKRWYTKYPDMTTLSFLYLKLEKFEYGTIIDSEELPEQHNTSDKGVPA